MRYIELFGTSIEKDIETVKNAIDEDSGVIFIYSGEQTLYNYIDKLNNKVNGLDDEYLYQFKV
ncbi:MAG: hypothetical protein K2O18_10645, partial [Oscillospiraceae bacterium]|nr:hypothetical protein [Oscillospiraceae bacterium]